MIDMNNRNPIHVQRDKYFRDDSGIYWPMGWHDGHFYYFVNGKPVKIQSVNDPRMRYGKPWLRDTELRKLRYKIIAYYTRTVDLYVKHDWCNSKPWRSRINRLVSYSHHMIMKLAEEYTDRTDKFVNAIIARSNGGCCCYPLEHVIYPDFPNCVLASMPVIRTPVAKLVTDSDGSLVWTDMDDGRELLNASANAIWCEANKPKN